MKTNNSFRSKAFIKIKHCIEKSAQKHLASCRQMIENATSILSKDELIILKEYFMEKEKEPDITIVNNAEWISQEELKEIWNIPGLTFELPQAKARGFQLHSSN